MARQSVPFIFIGCVMLSSCSSLYKIPPEVERQQQESLMRWNHCLNRVKSSTDPVHVTRDLISNVCEGQRRDVLLSFPPSVERQLDDRLKKRGMDAAAVRIKR